MEKITFEIILPIAFIIAIWFILHYQRLYAKYKGMYELIASKDKQILNDIIIKGFCMMDESKNIVNPLKTEFCQKCETEWTDDCQQFGCWQCGHRHEA